MKASIISILIIFGLATNFLLAQPALVAKSFKKEFPTAKKVEWVKENNNFWKAQFLLGGRKTSAEFDSEGHWYSTQQEIDLEEILNDEVRAAIKKDFSKCKIILVRINNWSLYGTSYDVEGICGEENKKLSYDSNGWPWPPKIT